VKTLIGSGGSGYPSGNNHYDTGIEVTAFMAWCIEIYLKTIDVGSGQVTLSQQFLDDWTHIFLAFVDDNGDIDKDVAPRWMPLSLADCYRLREAIPLEASVQSKKIGAVIHRRIYEAIAKTREDLVELVYREDDQEDGPGREEVRQLLEDGTYANSSEDTYSNTED
jgi:hypothetical protein